MLPKLGPLPFPTSYGLLVAAGLVLALLVLRRLAPRVGLPAQPAQDLLVWAALAGLLGAKLLLIALDPASFLRRPWEVLFQGGVFYGGLIAAVLTAYLLARRRGFDPHALGDAAAPALAIGHALGRIGCFLAGCCWGSACDLPWGVVYSHPDAAATAGIVPAGTPVHPVQLYEAAGNFGLAALAFALLWRRRFVGQVWWSYVLGYALLRFSVEELRGDERGEVLGGLFSTSQGIALLGALAAFVILYLRSSRPSARTRREGESSGRSESGPEPEAGP